MIAGQCGSCRHQSLGSEDFGHDAQEPAHAQAYDSAFHAVSLPGTARYDARQVNLLKAISEPTPRRPLKKDFHSLLPSLLPLPEGEKIKQGSQFSYAAC